MTHLLVILLLAVNNIYTNNKTSQIHNMAIETCRIQSESMQSDSLLVDIQSKISSAFVKGRISGSNDALNELGNQLENLYRTNSQNLIRYWQSYLQLYSSINYLSKGDNKQAEKEIEKGIELLESSTKKSSEDYALLAMLQSFSIQFHSMRAMFISESTRSNAKTAISIDSTNLRAWYVLASNDFYSPEQYGGGKVAEKYLLKAISLPEQSIKSGYLPSWGKEESYEMLTKLYINKGKWDLAKKYFQEGITAYPKSYVINQLATKLIGK